MPAHASEIFIFKDGALIESRKLSFGQYLIGRAEYAELRIEAEGVSQEHARLNLRVDGAFIEDLDSDSGVLVGSTLIAGEVPLLPGERAGIGSITIEIQSASTTTGPTVIEVDPHVTDHCQLPHASRYELGPLVAKGGMGAIHAVHDAAIHRRVAMKVMLDSSDGAAAARFREEAQITGQLEHPNIVPVHELGFDDKGSPFYTMKLVRGITLKKVLELVATGAPDMIGKYSLTTLLTIFQKVCDAVAFAHSRHVVHRDLKPENIMLGDYGEVLVMDWGLAKFVGASGEGAGPEETVYSERQADASAVTLSGTVMGTPRYMAPEQAMGEIALIDTRTDTYSLGAILYEMLTLHPPVSGSGVEGILKKVRAGDLASMTDGAGHLPGKRIPDSLRAVCRKALEYSRETRYQSVPALQEDIRAFQTGFATAAERASAWRQFTLLIKRHKAIAITSAASVVLLAVVSALYTARVVRERDRAERASTEAQTQRDSSEDRLYFSHMLLAGRDLAGGRPENARQLLERHFVEPSGRDLRDWEWYFLYGQLNQATLRVSAHHGSANAVAVSPNGTQIATVGDDGSVALWSASDLREVARWRVDEGSALCVAWDPSGKHLATGAASGTVRVWEAATQRKVAELIALRNRAVRAVAWEPVEPSISRVAIGTLGPKLLLWLPTHPTADVFVDGLPGVTSLSWSADGRRLAAGILSGLEATSVFDVASKKRIFAKKPPSGSDIFSVAFEPKTGFLATGAKHLSVDVYDLTDPAHPTTVISRSTHHGFITAVTWHPDGEVLASGSYDGTIHLANRLHPDDPPTILNSATGKIQGLAWATVPSPDTVGAPAHVLYSVSNDGTLSAWVGDRLGGQAFAARINNWVAKARWNPEGTLIAVVSYSNEVRIFDPQQGVLVRKLTAKTSHIFDIAWSPDGRSIATASQGPNSVRIFDVDTGQDIAGFGQSKPTRLSWSPNSRFLAVGGSPVDTRVWDVADKKLICTIPRPSGDLSWHPDGHRIAVGGRDGAVEIWDGFTGRKLTTLRSAPLNPGSVPATENEPPRNVGALAWSPAGDRLVIGTQDTVVEILDSTTGAIQRELSGHTGGVYAVTWSPNGQRIVTAGQDGSVRVFNAVTGEQVAEIPHGVGHREVVALDWTRDGDRLLTGGFDRFIRVWDTAPGRDLAMIITLEKRLAENPQDSSSLAALAESYTHTGFAARAREFYAQAVARAPEDSHLADLAEEAEYRLAHALFGNTGRVASFDVVGRITELCAQGNLTAAAHEYRKVGQDSASLRQRELARLQFARGKWKATWFASQVSPRGELAAWRKEAEASAAITEELPVINLEYRLTGPRGLKLTPALTKRGPNSENFGMIAHAELNLPPGTWKFVLRADDGARLIVNHQTLIEQWVHQGATMTTAVFRQKTNQPVDVVIEYFQEDGWAELKFGIEPLDE